MNQLNRKTAVIKTNEKQTYAEVQRKHNCAHWKIESISFFLNFNQPSSRDISLPWLL